MIETGPLANPAEPVPSATSLRASVLQPDGQQIHGESVFPYGIRCESPEATVVEAEGWIAEQKASLLTLAETHGAILLRDFPVDEVHVFDALVQVLSLRPFPYRRSLSNAVRVNRTELVFTANEAPSDVQIFLHHEMAQTPLFPRWLIFHCEVAAETGGATPLCRSDILCQRLWADCPDFVRACEERGLQYSNVMPDTDDAGSGMGRSWRSTLSVDDRAGAESRLSELGYRWEWQADGNLRATTPTLPALRSIGPGRVSFFNQVIAAYRGWKDERNDPSTALRHGDGTKLDAASVRRAIELADELAFELSWQAGDIAIIDNTVAMHGRRPFRGTRKIVASLAEMQTQAFPPSGRSALSKALGKTWFQDVQELESAE